MASIKDEPKHIDDVDFDFPDAANVPTVLVPTPVASYCYLFEALLWIALQRFPLLSEWETGADIRTVTDELEGLDPRVELDVVSDDECQRVGLPSNPEYAVYMAGDYHSPPEDLERIVILDSDPDTRKQFDGELAASREHHKRQDIWEGLFEEFLDLHKSRLFVALREGKILSVGKVLPAGVDSSFPADLDHEEWIAWSRLGWARIPANNWLSNGIDWEASRASGTQGAYALILVSTVQLMAIFPAESQPTDQVVRIGSWYRLSEQETQPRSTKRGRPSFGWDEFHLELARRLTTKGIPSEA